MAKEGGNVVTPETAMRCSVFFACVRVVAETVACLPLHLFRRIDDDSSERAKDHPLYQVLARRPNSWQTRYEWLEQMILHMAFHGISYQLKVPGRRGSVDELHPLFPGGMKMVQEEKTKEITYKYRAPGSGVEITYRQDQIMRVPWLCMDGITPMVPVGIGKDVISLARSLEQFASNFFKNNAQPGVILHTDQALPREVREELRDGWNQAHSGPTRAGRTAILTNGLKADTISATNQESQLADLWMQSLLSVCRVMRMPPHMVQELGRATWGNLASEMVSFEKFTIQPWLRRIEGAIERDILGDDDSLYAEFLVEGLLRSDITTRYAAYATAVENGWMTVEEVRRKENLGPLPVTAVEPPEETVLPEDEPAEPEGDGEEEDNPSEEAE
jgi:HK97 family phage portal protein